MKREALSQSREELEKHLGQKEKELYSIQRIGKALSSTLHLDELLDLIIREIISLMDADRGTLFIVDQERGEIWSKIALKAEVKEIRLPLGKGISGHVAATGEHLNIPDAYQDERFDPGTDRKTGYHTRSILCMPVWEPLGQGEERNIIAVIQVLNKNEGVFSEEDEALLESLASQVAISIANARLYHRLEKKYREIDLLYELEQLLSSEFDIQSLLSKLLGKTVDHLQARWVLAYFPTGDHYLFGGVNEEHQSRFASQTAVSLGWHQFARHPSPTELRKHDAELREYFHLREKIDWDSTAALFSPIELDEERQGLLLAIDVKVGGPQNYRDEQQVLRQLSQKIARALELHGLRENLLKRERLSAIGQMMSTVVHDIRSPVNTIYGFVDLIEDEVTTAEERAEYANIIREEIKATMNMVTEILDFAKGKTNILPRKTSARNLLKRFKPRLEKMCQNAGTSLTIEGDSTQLLYADEEKLDRVFYNITKNGLEAMGEKGEFLFRVSDNGKEVTFQFSDSGPGIPRDIQNRLFDSFVTSGKANGTGLGLAIVKKIVEEHRGHIHIDSQPGKGATFRITLPVYQR